MAKAGVEQVHESVQFHGHPRRFVVLAVFAVASALSAFVWISAAAVFTLVRDRYHATGLQINALSMSYMLAYAPGCVIAAGVSHAGGLRASLLCGIAFLVGCTVMRWCGDWIPHATTAYGVVLAGQVLGALGQPLLLNLPTRIAVDWFPVAQRDAATTTSTMANAVGNALGILVPPLVVATNQQWNMLLLGQAVVAVALMVVALASVTSRPPHPPSLTAAIQWGVVAVPAHPATHDAASLHLALPTPTDRVVNALAIHPPGHLTTTRSATSSTTDSATPAAAADLITPITTVPVVAAPTASTLPHVGRASMVAEGGLLFRNRNFLLLLVGFSMVVGMSWALLTVLAQLIQPCGYDNVVVGVAGSMFLLAGILPSFLVTTLLQRWHCYRLLQRVMFLAATGGMVAVLAVNRPGQLGAVYGAYTAFGVVFMPLLPLTLEHAAEVTFPVKPDHATAVLMTGANVIAAAFTFALTPVLELPVSLTCERVVTPAAGIAVLGMAVGTLCSLPLTLDYRRRALEAKHGGGSSMATGGVPLPPPPVAGADVA